MRLKPAHRLVLVAAVAAALAACEEKKTFRHDAEWAAPTRTPRAIHIDTPEGAVDAVETRLDDILAATQGVNSVADAEKAAARMKTAYADLETYYAALRKQAPEAGDPNRQAVAQEFFKTQQELAKAVAILLEKDVKIVEVIGGQLGNMPLIQEPPDLAPQDAVAPLDTIPSPDPAPSAVNPSPSKPQKRKAK